MSITYATFSEFTQVYSVRGVEVTEINSYWLPYGALRLNETLGYCFTTPFSSNNETAKDLSIHYAYLGILERQRTGNPDDFKVKVSVDKRIDDITKGFKPMILSDGSGLFANNNCNDSFSTTEDYNPTFNHLKPELQRVDIDLIDDELREVY